MRRALVCLALVLMLLPAAACRLALVLGLDASAGVDAVAYRGQLLAAAGALESPSVTEAALGAPTGPVSLMVFEWASHRFQRVILPWQQLETRADLAIAAARLRAIRRAPDSGAPAPGHGLRFAADALNSGPSCDRRVVDLSTSALGNRHAGQNPVVFASRLGDVVVNALVILPRRQGADPDGLVSYAARHVIQGPGAFIEVASGPSDYVRAITKKLLREIAGPGEGPDPPAQ
ncbi:MAG: DUF1194 domain-containing protein [Pseudomonadota bacterium]